MNISKFGRIICSIGLILIILFSCVGFSYAATASELNQQKKDIDEQIAAKKSEIADVKEQKSDALNQIKKLNAEIYSYEDEISELDSQINGLNSEIAVKETNIAEQEQKYADQKALLDKRLVSLYESGSTSYLDMLLSSDGLTDFISKYYMISQIAEFDEELLDNILNTKNQIESEKTALVNAQEQIKVSKTAVQAKKDSLNSSRIAKNKLVSNLTAEEAEKEKELQEVEEEKRAIQSKLAALSQSSGGKAVAPSACGYGTPIPGKTKANITTGYQAYPGHSGVDFASPSGTPITAVKSGTVVISKAARRPNGTYKSYGEYVAIDHHDGTVTLYAHMYPNSRAVREGDQVSQGQVIGKVGTTGNSTGNHLHFEVRVGGKAQNPTQYLP